MNKLLTGIVFACALTSLAQAQTAAAPTGACRPKTPQTANSEGAVRQSQDTQGQMKLAGNAEGSTKQAQGAEGTTKLAESAAGTTKQAQGAEGTTKLAESAEGTTKQAAALPECP